MATLTLGVLDVSYSDAQPGQEPETTTTGAVAEILEERYHVMGTFYELRKGRIGQYLADALATRLQDLFRGSATVGSPMYGAEQKIEAEFRSFLDANEMQKLAIALSGTPLSAAAMRGVSHRRKQPFSKKNRARPAFVDTGLYRSSFRALVKL